MKVHTMFYCISQYYNTMSRHVKMCFIVIFFCSILITCPHMEVMSESLYKHDFDILKMTPSFNT